MNIVVNRNYWHQDKNRIHKPSINCFKGKQYNFQDINFQYILQTRSNYIVLSKISMLQRFHKLHIPQPRTDNHYFRTKKFQYRVGLETKIEYIQYYKENTSLLKGNITGNCCLISIGFSDSRHYCLDCSLDHRGCIYFDNNIEHNYLYCTK